MIGEDGKVYENQFDSNRPFGGTYCSHVTKDVLLDHAEEIPATD